MNEEEIKWLQDYLQYHTMNQVYVNLMDTDKKVLYLIDKLLYENKQLKECYCNRTDCNGRIKDSKKYNNVVEEKDLYKSVIDEARKYVENLKIWHEHDDTTITSEDFRTKLLEILIGKSDE